MIENLDGLVSASWSKSSSDISLPSITWNSSSPPMFSSSKNECNFILGCKNSRDRINVYDGRSLNVKLTWLFFWLEHIFSWRNRFYWIQWIWTISAVVLLLKWRKVPVQKKGNYKPEPRLFLIRACTVRPVWVIRPLILSFSHSFRNWTKFNSCHLCDKVNRKEW